MTPRARPKLKAAAFASVGRAATNSQKATRAFVRARIAASKGAFVKAIETFELSERLARLEEQTAVKGSAP